MGELGGLLGFNIADGYPYGIGQLGDYTNNFQATPPITAEVIAQAVMQIKKAEAEREALEKARAAHYSAQQFARDAEAIAYRVSNHRRKLLLCAA